jgi:tape measure domain-containing protein
MGSIGDLNIRIGATIEGLQKGLQKAERSLNRSASRMNNVGRQLSFTLTASIGIVGVAAVKTAAEFETLQNGLNILTGSAEAGGKAFQRLKDFSSKTPFQLQDLVKANNILMGFGLNADQAYDSLGMMGNIAAIMGSDFNRLSVSYGQIAAAGVAMTRDVREFINNGIPMWELLQKETGKSVAELQVMATKQQITFDMIQRSFRRATSEGGKFYKGLEKGSKTLAGVFSTLKDNLSLALGEVGKSIAEVLNLREVALTLSKTLGNIAKGFSNLPDGLKKAIVVFAGILAAVGPVLVAFASLKFLAAGLIGGLGSILSVATVLTAAFVGVAVAVAKLYIQYGKVNGLAKKVNKSVEKNALSYLKEQKSIDKLRTASNNMALSLEERQDAYDQLVKEYPDYFDAVDIEEGKVVNVVKKYDELIQKLKDVARARAITQQMQELEQKKLELEIEVSAEFPGFTLDEIGEKIEHIAAESNKTFGGRLKNNLSEILQTIGLVDEDWLSVENQLDEINALNREINKLAKMGVTTDTNSNSNNNKEDDKGGGGGGKDTKAQDEADRQAARNAYFRDRAEREKKLQAELAQLEAQMQQDRNEHNTALHEARLKKLAEIAAHEAETAEARNQYNIKAAEREMEIRLDGWSKISGFLGGLTGVMQGIGQGLSSAIDSLIMVDWSTFADSLAGGFEAAFENIASIASAIGAVVTGIAQSVSAGIQTQMDALDASHQQQLAQIDELAMSDEARQQHKAQAEKKYAREMAVLRRKQAKADKTAAISSAITSGALAVMTAFAQLGPVGGPIAAAALAGITAAQVGVIASQPIPQFANGGIVSGRTLAEVGEYGSASRGNPEVIAPLDKLKSMLGDIGGGSISGEFRLRGDDLVAAVDQANSKSRRFSGRTQL